MKKPVNRLILTIVLAVLFLIAYSGIMYSIGRRHYEELIVIHNENQTENFIGILNQCQKTEKEIGNVYCDDLNAEVRLKTIALADKVVNGKYTGERFFGDAMVVRIANGSLDIPKEAAGMLPELSAENVEKEYEQAQLSLKAGEGSPMNVLLTSGRIANDWYYVRWTPAKDYFDYVTSNISISQLLEEMSDEYGGEMFIVSSGTTGNESDTLVPAIRAKKGTILYGTDGLRDHASIQDLGLSEEDLKKNNFSLNLTEKDAYICTPVKLASGQVFVSCYSVSDGKYAFKGNIVTQILFAFALLVGLITWCYSVIWMVAAEELSEEQLKKYTPSGVRKRTARLGSMSVLLVFVVAYMTVAMQYMYEEAKTASASLGLLGRQLEEGNLTASELKKTDAERYVSFGKEISQILTENPEYLNQDFLSHMADVISADYLIVFDENGDEIGCSEEYSGFSLEKDKKEPSTDFRRLLKGIPSIIHETERDFITGENRQIVGVRYRIPDKEVTDSVSPGVSPDSETADIVLQNGGSGKYGALLVSLPVLNRQETADSASDKQEIYNLMVSGGAVILEIDPETQLIESSSRDDYVGANASVLGIKKESLADGHMDFFRIDKKRYFSVSRMIGGNVFFYMTGDTRMLTVGLVFALLTAGIFLVGYWGLAWFALHKYTNESYQQYVPLIQESSQKTREKLNSSDATVNSLVRFFADLPPEKKTKVVLQVLMGVFMVVLLLIAISNTPLAEYSALNFVIDGNWTKGINVFGVVAAIMVISVEYLLYLLLKVLFYVLYDALDAKAETTSRLIRSLLNYILYIGAICLSLNFLGVDLTTLLASLGLFSLAISLGAKDIVADILSGISIIFEETYSVGDYVEIGGYTGKVIEIGVRSTKLLGGKNDVKTILNHDINNVINLSKRISYCSVTFTVKAVDPLDQLEAMLERELPALRDQIPGVIVGPRYAGVTKFEDGTLTLAVSAGGKEEDRIRIQLALNRAIQSLYERKLLVPIKKTTNVALKFEEGDPGTVRVQHPSEDKKN